MWNSKWTGGVIFVILTVLSIVTFHVPAPGVAVAILACAAGVASVRENHWVEKILWTALFSTLLYLEVRAIRIDRAENDAKQALFFSNQDASFKKISEEAAKNFERTSQDLTKALEVTQRAANSAKSASDLAREAALDVTGGDSFAYVYPYAFGNIGGPLSHYTFKIHNPGDRAITGILITGYEANSEEEFTGLKIIKDVGTLSPHDGRDLHLDVILRSNSHLIIYINSQTPSVKEDIYFRAPTKPNRPPSFRFTVERFIWHKPKPDDKRQGNHWIRNLKAQDWTDDYTDSDLTKVP